MSKRNIHEKEGFLKGNRQRWCVIFLLSALPILGLDALNVIEDATTYLTFLTFLSGSFILGYSGTETMKLFRATSNTSNENINETVKITKDEQLIQDYRQKYADDPSYPPDGY